MDKNKANRTYDGIVFDSKLEMSFYRDWVLPKLNSGELSKCGLQVKHELQEKFTHEDNVVRAIVYVADFLITHANGSQTVIDIKGQPDSVAKLKRKLFWFRYPGVDYRWMGFSKIDGGWVDYEVIQAGRKSRKKANRESSK